MDCAIRDHRWIASRRAREEKCETCDTRFPCRDADCGHFDCIEHRFDHGDKSMCYVCARRLDPAVGERVILAGDGTVKLRYSVHGVRGRLRAVCGKCVEVPPPEGGV